MDFVSSIFQLDSVDDDLFQIPSYPCQQLHSGAIFPQDKAAEALPPPPKPSEDGSEITNDTAECSGGGGRRRKPSAAFGESKDDGNNPSDSKKKKIIHRDIERQRRQQMATLYKSLRSLLPLEYVKGKRAVSDHIHEAAKYIKHLEGKIQEIGAKRDELKRLSDSSSDSPSSSNMERRENCNKEDTLTVRPCLVGVEVLMDTALRKGLPLSRVVQVLIQEGLSIISCMSTKVNERMLHTITSEVSDGRSVDTDELQEKLKINNWVWRTTDFEMIYDTSR